MIVIVDYGMGNLRSVQKAFERAGFGATVSSNPDEVAKADKIVVPGVGAFQAAMEALRGQGLVEPIKEAIAAGKPFLGICLGLQLLFETSYEDGRHEGLGVFRGDVVRFDEGLALRVPHMGWNSISIEKKSSFLEGIPADSHFYFVHSYYVAPRDADITLTSTDYGVRFASSVERDNVIATQFHPEKSQSFGLELLRNFASR